VTLLLVVVGIAIVAGVALLVVRGQPVLDEDRVEARSLAWPPPQGVGPDSLAAARFTVALRGYRMEEVDRVLDDARAALIERDARISDLERVVNALAPRSSEHEPTGAERAPWPADAHDPGPHAAGDTTVARTPEQQP
jgi:DivIVA domain-containing protein